MRRRLSLALLLLAPLLFSSSAGGSNPTDAHYRAFWVDTFNTALNNHNDVLAVVLNAQAANANAILAQVRRRGDSWYVTSLEPPPDGVPIEAGFDPLQDLIAEAHARGIELHAFVIVGAVYNRHPVILGLPSSPNHVFNRHGGFNAATGRIEPGPDNWLTRSLIPDGTGGVTFQGHRIGPEFWMEPGHPDAAADTVDVLTHLVRNYDVDGLHLDRIRYPEISIGGQTPSTGTSIGYNDTSLARFRRRYGLAPGTIPAQNDPLWNQWRRDQVSNLVRRVYLEALAVKPQLKVSAALIAFGGFSSWPSAEAYWRVYQDWDAWTREGILDLAIPMVYKAEHSATVRPQFNQWSEWTKDHAYDRAVLIGQGGFVNSIEGTLPQVRRALAPSTAGHFGSGVVFFSMANPDVAVTANPLAIPPGNTPKRGFAEFASGLTTGRSVDGAQPYEDAAANPVAVFATPAAIPDMPWKSHPHVGHLKGVITDESGALVDAGDVTIARVDDGSAPTGGRTSVASATDGGGFYGGVDLAPGAYRLTVTPTGQAPWTSSCPAVVTAGHVTTLDLAIDRHPPAGTLTVDPGVLWPPNHKMVTVTVRGEATDVGTGIESVAFRVTDEYGRVEPTIAVLAGNGSARLEWQLGIELEAGREGSDRDGRVYTVEAVVTDRACQAYGLTATVVVPHDRRE